jgi:hypothetical protein
MELRLRSGTAKIFEAFEGLAGGFRRGMASWTGASALAIAPHGPYYRIC